MGAAPDRVIRHLALLLASMLVVGLVAGGAARPVAAQGADLSAHLRQQLQDVIDQARPDEPVPGISAAVATPDDAWTGVTGLARFHPDRPVDPDTPFEIGSVTKTFVAAVILQLRDEGKLSLSDHLSRWETKIPNARRITVRQLLSHTSGVRDMWWNPHYVARVEGRPGHVWTYPEVRAMIGPARFSPGTRWEYSNSNYVLLGRIIQLVTRAGVADAIRTRLLDPLHLDDTWYQGAEDGPRAPAMGYLRSSGRWIRQGNGKGLRPTTSIATFFGASGAMVSTPRDLATWARALYGGHVLSAVSLQAMTRFNSHKYGLGVRRFNLDGRVVWGHGGSLDGFETTMWYLPGLDSAVVVIWNRRGDDTDPIARKLARRVVNSLDPDTTPPTMGPPVVALRSGTTATPGHAPVRVSWSRARDSQGAISRYEVRRRTADGPWQAIRLESPLALSVTLAMRIDRPTRVEVRAFDGRGNAGAWMSLGPMVARFIDETDPAVTRGSGWHIRTEADALGGHVLASVLPKSRLSVSVRALAVAVVAPRSRSMTRASVAFDASPSVVMDLHAPRRLAHWTLMSRRWAAPADHSLRITVRQATPARIEIDGFLVLEESATP